MMNAIYYIFSQFINDSNKLNHINLFALFFMIDIILSRLFTNTNMIKSTNEDEKMILLMTTNKYYLIDRSRFCKL
jgi:hypothetical protein